jgi:hypothetical protein
MAIPTREVAGLAMAVRAKELQVLEPIVVANAVDVMERH